MELRVGLEFQQQMTKKNHAIGSSEEKRLLKELAEQIMKTVSRGNTWETVIYKWEEAMNSEKAYYRYEAVTILDHVACLTRWTESWLKRPAAEINRADTRDVFRNMRDAGRTFGFQKHVKNTINVIYRWGIEERLIPGVNKTPVEGFKLDTQKAERVPDIFTIDEIRILLREGKRMKHLWYPIWAMALLTGMRNGELFALTWSDIDFVNRRITVSKSYDTRMRKTKSTKAGYWRTVPISDELESLLKQLKATSGNGEFVLPHNSMWHKGEQAKVLKMFCRGIGIRPIKFHALRACFATQLLANNVAPAQIMKVCGWKDLKTMQFYIRLAGIEERGTTQSLRFLPSDAELANEVVQLFGIKS